MFHFNCENDDVDNIAAAMAAHRGQVTLFVPLYALSGGLELAQTADSVVLGPRAAVRLVMRTSD